MAGSVLELGIRRHEATSRLSFVRLMGTPAAAFTARPLAYRWLVRLPTALFFGWITAATILNTGVWLKGRGVTSLGLGAEAWATVLLLVAAGIGVFIVRRFGEVLYGLVLIWAAWGILESAARLLRPDC